MRKTHLLILLLVSTSTSWGEIFYEFAEFSISSGIHHFEEPEWLKVRTEGEGIKVFTSDDNTFTFTKKAGSLVSSKIRGKVSPLCLVTQRMISLPFSPSISPDEVFLYLKATSDDIETWRNIRVCIATLLMDNTISNNPLCNHYIKALNLNISENIYVKHTLLEKMDYRVSVIIDKKELTLTFMKTTNPSEYIKALYNKQPSAGLY